MDAWRDMWRTEEVVSKLRNLEQVKDAISGHSALFAESLDALYVNEWSASAMVVFSSYFRKGIPADDVLMTS